MKSLFIDILFYLCIITLSVGCVALYMLLIIHVFCNNNSEFHWINWYKAYKDKNYLKANKIKNTDGVNINHFYFTDIENNVLSTLYSKCITFICSIILFVTLIASWNNLAIYKGFKEIRLPFSYHPLTLVILIILCDTLGAVYIINYSIKIAESFYNISINISNILESSLNTIIPFYLAELSLFLSAYASSGKTYYFYMCISLLIIGFFALFIYLGIDADIKKEIKDTLYNKRNTNHINNINSYTKSTYTEVNNAFNNKKINNHINNIEYYTKNIFTMYRHFIKNEPVVEIPINNTQDHISIIEVPLRNIRNFK